MRDLEEIKRINSEPGVGDKLGADNGNSHRLYDRQQVTRQTIRIATYKSKSPWEDSDPICHDTPNLLPRPNAKLDAFERDLLPVLTGSHGRVIL